MSLTIHSLHKTLLQLLTTNRDIGAMESLCEYFWNDEVLLLVDIQG